jgi:hypothetical protein
MWAKRVPAWTTYCMSSWSVTGTRLWFSPSVHQYPVHISSNVWPRIPHCSTWMSNCGAVFLVKYALAMRLQRVSECLNAESGTYVANKCHRDTAKLIDFHFGAGKNSRLSHKLWYIDLTLFRRSQTLCQSPALLHASSPSQVSSPEASLSLCVSDDPWSSEVTN